MISYKDNNMEIINDVNECKLVWKKQLKNNKKKTVRKSGEIVYHDWYVSGFPKSLVDVLNVIDNKIYFYQLGRMWIITGSVPVDDKYRAIKLQKNSIKYDTRQFSIPRRILDWFGCADPSELILTYNCLAVEKYSGTRGVLSVEVK